MHSDHDTEEHFESGQKPTTSAQMAVVLALSALAAVTLGIAVQQVRERRLTTPEKARLRFYRYLREKGRLES